MAMGAMPKETFKQAIEEILFPDIEMGDDEVLVAVITDEDGKETIEVVGEEPTEEPQDEKTEE